MSKEAFEKLAKLHARISDTYEELAAAADEGGEAEPPDEDVPPPKGKAGTTGKTPAKKPAKAVEPDPDLDPDVDPDAPTEEDVVAAATKLIKATDRETALKIVAKFGGKRVADLDEAKYSKVIAAFEAAMPKGKGKPAKSEDDDI